MQELVRAQDRIGKFDTLIGLKDGRIAAVEKRRLYEYPFFILTDPPNNDVVSPANATSPQTAMRVSGEGPVQMTQMGAVQDGTHGNVLVRLYIRDGSQQIQISNLDRADRCTRFLKVCISTKIARWRLILQI